MIPSHFGVLFPHHTLLSLTSRRPRPRSARRSRWREASGLRADDRRCGIILSPMRKPLGRLLGVVACLVLSAPALPGVQARRCCHRRRHGRGIPRHPRQVAVATASATTPVVPPAQRARIRIHGRGRAWIRQPPRSRCSPRPSRTASNRACRIQSYRTLIAVCPAT